MISLFSPIRSPFNLRAGDPARGPAGQIRASDIILCFTLMMLVVALLASAVIYLFAA